MIHSIKLENFKGIREQVSIDLKPITLLFGPNSSGKSSLIHALHYAYEVLARHNLDADRTTHGGAAVDLGGFRNLIHGHDLGERLRIEVEIDLSTHLLADYTLPAAGRMPASQESLGMNLEDAELDDRIFSGSVAVVVGVSVRPSVP